MKGHITTSDNILVEKNETDNQNRVEIEVDEIGISPPSTSIGKDFGLEDADRVENPSSLLQSAGQPQASSTATLPPL